MKNYFLFLFVVLSCSFTQSCYSQGDPANLSAADIVKAADDVRNPSETYFLKIEVDSSESPDDLHLFLVGIKTNAKTLIETVQPTRERGRNLLMLDQNMWAYVPNLKRSVRLALNQKLAGQAANGDISRLRWSGDYDAEIESQDSKNWVLLLSANKEDLTYDKLRVWIQKETFYPQKAQYLTKDGKVLKNVTYKGYRSIAGKNRPTEIVIEDAIRPADRSVIKILDMRPKNFSEAIFNQNTLDAQHLR